MTDFKKKKAYGEYLSTQNFFVSQKFSTQNFVSTVFFQHKNFFEKYFFSKIFFFQKKKILRDVHWAQITLCQHRFRPDRVKNQKIEF